MCCGLAFGIFVGMGKINAIDVIVAILVGDGGGEGGVSLCENIFLLIY